MTVSSDGRLLWLSGGVMRRRRRKFIPADRVGECRRRSSRIKLVSSSSSSSPQSIRYSRFSSSSVTATDGHKYLYKRRFLRKRRYAVLGAGFAGLSVAYHLLESSSKGSSCVVDLYDEVGIGGGASGVAGGLIHPYSPKCKLLWRGAEFWKECMNLLSIAERALKQDPSREQQFVWRRGIIKPATTERIAEILKENSSDMFGKEFLNHYAAEKLIPGLHLPYDSSIYMPHAVNIHAGCYLQALFLACKEMVDDPNQQSEIRFFKRSIQSLHDLEDGYHGVIICLGAKATMIEELSNLLPLRLCRGVIAHMELPHTIREVYGDSSPSILSDAWMAVNGPRSLVMGSTWDWGSTDSCQSVSYEEASRSLEELIPKIASVYPSIKKWKPVEMKGGLRAMPPLTSLGSMPLLGCLDDMMGDGDQCRYWIVGGLGARGLLYHGLLGKLTSQAVISQDEDIIPTELTSWKRLLFKDCEPEQRKFKR